MLSSGQCHVCRNDCTVTVDGTGTLVLGLHQCSLETPASPSGLVRGFARSRHQNSEGFQKTATCRIATGDIRTVHNKRPIQRLPFRHLKFRCCWLFCNAVLFDLLKPQLHCHVAQTLYPIASLIYCFLTIAIDGALNTRWQRASTHAGPAQHISHARLVRPRGISTLLRGTGTRSALTCCSDEEQM
jgi:hypothetical protein